ncbi:MAG: serine hydrolase [Bacteroidales bacterium]|nr:serine hydrolase [Bacteroidales bacterium]
MKRELLILIMLLPALLFAQPKTERWGACVSHDYTEGINVRESFALHSVMKFPQAIYVADYLNRNGLALTDTIVVDKAKLMQDTWSPMLKMFEGRRDFSYAELLELSLAQSDNNACDILFEHCGKPKVVTKFLHKLGFPNIHIRFTERQLHKNPAKAIENNATPWEMVRLFEWLYNHKDDNQYLTFVWNTMSKCSTGLKRIPAAIPEGATIVHKTGTGFPNGDGTQDMNDAGVVILPDGRCVFIAIFIANSKSENEIAELAKQLLPK